MTMSAGKTAVVGCGYWGKNLVRNFSQLGALAAVVDGRSEVADAMAAQFNVPAMSFEQVLANPDIDSVVIAAPAELHAELSIRAFEAGKHVYVEKPIAMSMDEGRAMKAASEKAGKILMVGHLLRYHPAFEALLDFVRGGGIGEVRYAYSNSFAPHDVSMLLALMDEKPSAVRISGGAFVTKGIEDESRIDMDFKSGRRAHVFTSWLHPFKEQKLVVVGSTGMAVFEDSQPGAEKLRVYRHSIDVSGREPVPVKAESEPLPYGDGEPLRQECAHFVECCKTGQNPRTDADEALSVLAVMIGELS
jgi:predicted dehydrogenase